MIPRAMPNDIDRPVPPGSVGLVPAALATRIVPIGRRVRPMPPTTIAVA